MPEDVKAIGRLSDWMEENAERATPAMKPLLAMVNTSRINNEKLKLLKSRILSNGNAGMISFASLAEGAGPNPSDGTSLLAEEKDKPVVDRKSLKVLFFYKPGCKECASTRKLLGALKNDFPLLEVEERNILETDGTELNQALCIRFNEPSIRQSVAPAVFAQGGYAIGTDSSHEALSKLMAETMKLPQDDAWQVVDEERHVQAARVVEDRYENITLSIVVLGGLLDGINPCAFATIIFFLSYLQIARRTPREMLWVGVAFISAVFLAYLAAGLLLHQAIDALSGRFAGIQRWMNYGFGALALVAAWLSLRDARLARAGRLGDMALQLPGFLKERIRSVIRVGTRARNFIIAAFVSGLVVSLLELACTGQVYAPIIYQIQKGRLDAVFWLIIYNLAFITPLIVIFLMAYGGLRSESLMALQKKHTFAVKLALAALFLGLALVIFLSA
jgi:cytochrome c biogenesis protein CcdA